MLKEAKPDKVKIRLQDIPLEEIESQIEQGRIEERKRIGEFLGLRYCYYSTPPPLLLIETSIVEALKQGKLPKGA